MCDLIHVCFLPLIICPLVWVSKESTRTTIYISNNGIHSKLSIHLFSRCVSVYVCLVMTHDMLAKHIHKRFHNNTVNEEKKSIMFEKKDMSNEQMITSFPIVWIFFFLVCVHCTMNTRTMCACVWHRCLQCCQLNVMWQREWKRKRFSICQVLDARDIIIL